MIVDKSPQATHNMILAGNQMLTALRLTAFFEVGLAYGIGKSQHTAMSNGWLNEELAVETKLPFKSRSPMVARHKFGELLALNPVVHDDEIRWTPMIPKKDGGCGWLGGVQVGPRIVAISAQPQHYDRLFAAILQTTGFEDTPAEFDRVMRPNGHPLVVLRSGNPNRVLDFLAYVCEVEPQNYLIEGAQTEAFIEVRKEIDDDRGPAMIGVAVEQG